MACIKCRAIVAQAGNQTKIIDCMHPNASGIMAKTDCALQDHQHFIAFANPDAKIIKPFIITQFKSRMLKLIVKKYI